MALLARGQVWAQHKGHVRVEVQWFCKAGQCATAEPSRHIRDVYYQDHVHVHGWHGTTRVPTNHTVIKVKRLLNDWYLEVPHDA